MATSSGRVLDAVTGHLEGLWTTSANELEFLAEFETVDIVPNFEGTAFPFLTGRTDKFRPQRPVTVPLWLALLLKKRGQCRIVIPAWLQKDELAARLEEEKREESAFGPMPQHFQEISTLLFETAVDDIEHANDVRSLLADIKDLRHAKMRKGLQLLRDSEAVKLNNISHMEVHSVRPFFVKSMRTFYQLTEGADLAEGAA